MAFKRPPPIVGREIVDSFGFEMSGNYGNKRVRIFDIFHVLRPNQTATFDSFAPPSGAHCGPSFHPHPLQILGMVLQPETDLLGITCGCSAKVWRAMCGG